MLEEVLGLSMTLYLISYLSYVYFPTRTLKQSENAIKKLLLPLVWTIFGYHFDKKHEGPQESGTNSMVVLI